MVEPYQNRDHSGPVGWMAGNHVAANLLMAVLLIGGLLFGMRIKQEVFPEFDTDQISVSVPYPGASPEEVEQAIVLVLEEAARGLDDVDEITSVASEGVGVITVDLIPGADVQKLTQDLKNDVDRVTTFPEDAEEPRVTIASRRRDVVSLVIYGDQEESVLRETAESVRDRLMQDPDISFVELAGVRPHEISVEISQEKLRAHNLTLGEVARRLREASIELPGGGMKTEGGEILLRMKERRDFGNEFERIPIVSQEDGTRLYLEDIARVIDDFEDVDRYLTYNGKPAAMVTVYRIGQETPLRIARAAERYVQELNESLPAGLRVAIWQDRFDVQV